MLSHASSVIQNFSVDLIEERKMKEKRKHCVCCVYDVNKTSQLVLIIFIQGDSRQE